MKKSYSVLQGLPGDGQKCLCYGYKTYCCEEDKDDEREWHEVTFKFIVAAWKIKKEISDDLQENISYGHEVFEKWEIGPEFEDGHVIGVTEWRKLNED